MFARAALLAVLVLTAAGCANLDMSQGTPTQAAIDPAKIPQTGIFTVKDVVVTDEGPDTVKLTGAATNKFTFAELSSVIWCRAREEAVARKYDGWWQEGMQQINNGPSQPQVGIATAKFFKGKAPEGRQTLRQEKNPCVQVPPVARAKV
jgi:hypothetical protein